MVTRGATLWRSGGGAVSAVLYTMNARALRTSIRLTLELVYGDSDTVLRLQYPVKRKNRKNLIRKIPERGGNFNGSLRRPRPADRTPERGTGRDSDGDQSSLAWRDVDEV